MAARLTPPILLQPPWNTDQLTAVLEEPFARRLAPWLYLQCRECPGDVSDGLLGRLQQAHLATLRHELLQRQELLSVMAALDAVDIASIPLKGPLLADRIYKRAGGRPSADLDILVQPHDMEAAGSVLLAKGYRQIYEGTYDIVYGRDGPGDVPWVVELHHDLGFMTKRSRSWQDQIWTRTTTLQADQHSYLAMDRHDEFIFLCLNLVKHRFDDPLLALDVHLACQTWADLDWPEVTHRANFAGLTAYVAISCRFSQHWFGQAAPTTFWPALSTTKIRYFQSYEWTGRALRFFRKFPLGKQIHILWHLLLLSSTWRDRWDHIATATAALKRRIGLR